MHEFLSHFWIRCPYYTLTTPYNCLILMFSSKICYLFTVCTRSHDPLSGENLSPHISAISSPIDFFCAIRSTGQYVNRIIKKGDGVINKTFVEMLDALGYDIQLTYVKKEEA